MKEKEEKINLYCKDYIEWMNAKGNLGMDIFPFYNLDSFYNVCFALNEAFKNYKFKDDVNTKDFVKMDFFNKVDLVKDFFKSINMDIDVEKSLQDGTINPSFIEFNYEDMDAYMKKGRTNIDSNDNGDVTFPNSGMLLDSIVMVHELGHYTNRLNHTSQSAIMSEVIAIYTELQFYDYLSNLGYDKEIHFFKDFRLKDTKKLAQKCLSSISLLLTYMKYGTLNEENYYKMFPNNNYLDSLNKITDKHDFYSISMNMNYTVGFLMATYLYGKTKEDFSFTENINVFNKHLNEHGFYENLNMLGVPNFDKESMDNISKHVIGYLNQDDMIKAKVR